MGFDTHVAAEHAGHYAETVALRPTWLVVRRMRPGWPNPCTEELPVMKVGLKSFLVTALAALSLHALSAVNINTASQAELEKLNGIGPVKAKAIIDYRSKNGPFKSVDDLEKVGGIGKATINKFRAEVNVGGATKPATAKPADAKKQ
jgi:competence protein ComEA